MQKLLFKVIDRLIGYYIDYRVQQDEKEFMDVYTKQLLEETEYFVKPPIEFIN